MSMRRQINWPAMQRDMKRYRSPEQMLIREMLDVLKEAQVSIDADADPTTYHRISAAIRKAERHTNV
jgi:hypothetical protein